MDELEGKVVVVTGGASGIGLALAERFASEGMRVVLGDIEEAALAGAVERLRAGGVEAVGVVVDVADPASMTSLADEADQVFGGWDLVCLNAGVGSGGPSWEIDLGDWEWVLGVNQWGVIHGIRTFVPALVAKGEGHVVITASLAGLVASPYMAPYNASKFAAVALGETLHAELAEAAPGVGVSVLCPAWVSTRIFESGRNRPEHLPAPPADPRRVDAAAFFAAAMSPAQVAEAVLEAVRERRLHVLTHDFSADAIRARAERIVGGA